MARRRAKRSLQSRSVDSSNSVRKQPPPEEYSYQCINGHRLKIHHSLNLSELQNIGFEHLAVDPLSKEYLSDYFAKSNRSYEDQIDFCLRTYGSSNSSAIDIDSKMKTKGELKVLPPISELPFENASNLKHWISTEDILRNLQPDNELTEEFNIKRKSPQKRKLLEEPSPCNKYIKTDTPQIVDSLRFTRSDLYSKDEIVNRLNNLDKTNYLLKNYCGKTIKVILKEVDLEDFQKNKWKYLRAPQVSDDTMMFSDSEIRSTCSSPRKASFDNATLQLPILDVLAKLDNEIEEDAKLEDRTKSECADVVKLDNVIEEDTQSQSMESQVVTEKVPNIMIGVIDNDTEETKSDNDTNSENQTGKDSLEALTGAVMSPDLANHDYNLDEDTDIEDLESNNIESIQPEKENLLMDDKVDISDARSIESSNERLDNEPITEIQEENKSTQVDAEDIVGDEEDETDVSSNTDCSDDEGSDTDHDGVVDTYEPPPCPVSDIKEIESLLTACKQPSVVSKPFDHAAALEELETFCQESLNVQNACSQSSYVPQNNNETSLTIPTNTSNLVIEQQTYVTTKIIGSSSFENANTHIANQQPQIFNECSAYPLKLRQKVSAALVSPTPSVFAEVKSKMHTHALPNNVGQTVVQQNVQYVQHSSPAQVQAQQNYSSYSSTSQPVSKAPAVKVSAAITNRPIAQQTTVRQYNNVCSKPSPTLIAAVNHNQVNYTQHAQQATYGEYNNLSTSLNLRNYDITNQHYSHMPNSNNYVYTQTVPNNAIQMMNQVPQQYIQTPPQPVQPIYFPQTFPTFQQMTSSFVAPQNFAPQPVQNQAQIWSNQTQNTHFTLPSYPLVNQAHFNQSTPQSSTHPMQFYPHQQ